MQGEQTMTTSEVMQVAPVTLEGGVVRLEPLTMGHAAGLYAAAQDERIWRWMPTKLYGSLERIEAWIEAALQAQESGTDLPFATILRATGEPVGATRYLNISPRDRGLEIGWTWLNPRVQRTAVNTECKYLLLRHAFETLGAIRVQLKTDRAQHDLAARHRAAGRRARGGAAQADDPRRRLPARHGVLQHPRRRVAGGARAPRSRRWRRASVRND